MTDVPAAVFTGSAFAPDPEWSPELVRDVAGGLSHVLNVHSIDNRTNTPDFILAEMLVTYLRGYEAAQRALHNWKGGDDAR